MESSIEGLDELHPLLASLKEKGLLFELTPPGRGQVITHNLYLANELERLQMQFKGFQAKDDDEGDEGDVNESNAGSSQSQSHRQGSPPELDSSLLQRVDRLESMVNRLQEQVADLKKLIES